IGSVSIAHPLGTSNAFQTGLSHDRFVPGLQRLANAVHSHGARLGLQIVHAGKVAINDSAAGRPLWVPSIPAPPGDPDPLLGMAAINNTAAGRPRWSPSIPAPPGHPDPLFGMVTAEELSAQTAPYQRPGASVEYHEMTHDDIATVVRWFAEAAARARRAGVDA